MNKSAERYTCFGHNCEKNPRGVTTNAVSGACYVIAERIANTLRGDEANSVTVEVLAPEFPVDDFPVEVGVDSFVRVETISATDDLHIVYRSLMNYPKATSPGNHPLIRR